MFKVKQLFTKNHLRFLLMTLFLVCFTAFGVICSQSLKVSKSYQNKEVTSIKKLLGVSNTGCSKKNVTTLICFRLHIFYTTNLKREI